MQENRFRFTVTLICTVLGVSRQALYKHLNHSELASNITNKHFITKGRTRLYDDYAFIKIALSFKDRKGKQHYKANGINLHYKLQCEKLTKRIKALESKTKLLKDINQKLDLLINHSGITYK